MITSIAVLLGGSNRALQLARKLNHFALWFIPLEGRRNLRVADRQLDMLIKSLRRAA